MINEILNCIEEEQERRLISTEEMNKWLRENLNWFDCWHIDVVQVIDIIERRVSFQ